MKKIFTIALALMVSLSPINLNAKNVAHTDSSNTDKYTVKAINQETTLDTYKVTVSIEEEDVEPTVGRVDLGFSDMANMDVSKDASGVYTLELSIKEYLKTKLSDSDKADYEALFADLETVNNELAPLVSALETAQANLEVEQDKMNDLISEKEILEQEKIDALALIDSKQEELNNLNTRISELQGLIADPSTPTAELANYQLELGLHQTTLPKLNGEYVSVVNAAMDKSQELDAKLADVSNQNNPLLIATQEVVEKQTAVDSKESIVASKEQVIIDYNASKVSAFSLGLKVQSGIIIYEDFEDFAAFSVGVKSGYENPVNPSDSLNELIAELEGMKTSIGDIKADLRFEYTQGSIDDLNALIIEIDAMLSTLNTATEITPTMSNDVIELRSNYISTINSLEVVEASELELLKSKVAYYRYLIDQLISVKDEYQVESFEAVYELEKSVDAINIALNNASVLNDQLIDAVSALNVQVIEVIEGLILLPQEIVEDPLQNLRDRLASFRFLLDQLIADEAKYTPESFAPVYELEKAVDAIILALDAATELTDQLVAAVEVVTSKVVEVVTGLELVQEDSGTEGETGGETEGGTEGGTEGETEGEVETVVDVDLVRLRELLADLKAEVNVILVNSELYTEESIAALLVADAKLVKLIEKTNKATVLTNELSMEALEVTAEVTRAMLGLVLLADSSVVELPKVPAIDKTQDEVKDSVAKTPVTGLSNNGVYYVLILVLASATLITFKKSRRFS